MSAHEPEVRPEERAAVVRQTLGDLENLLRRAQASGDAGLEGELARLVGESRAELARLEESPPFREEPPSAGGFDWFTPQGNAVPPADGGLSWDWSTPAAAELDPRPAPETPSAPEPLPAPESPAATDTLGPANVHASPNGETPPAPGPAPEAEARNGPAPEAPEAPRTALSSLEQRVRQETGHFDFTALLGSTPPVAEAAAPPDSAPPAGPSDPAGIITPAPSDPGDAVPPAKPPPYSGFSAPPTPSDSNAVPDPASLFPGLFWGERPAPSAWSAPPAPGAEAPEPPAAEKPPHTTAPPPSPWALEAAIPAAPAGESLSPAGLTPAAEVQPSSAEPAAFAPPAGTFQPPPAPLEAVSAEAAPAPALPAPPIPESPAEPLLPGTALRLSVSVGRRNFRCSVRTTAEYVVGRRDPARRICPDLDLSPDDAVSRRHARITTRDGCYYFVDMGSLNGTILNDRRLRPHVPALLRPGDEILLGESSRILVIEAPASG